MSKDEWHLCKLVYLHFDTNSIGQWEEKLFSSRQINASEWGSGVRRINLYDVKVFGVKDDICQELELPR